eukprot:2206449-Amphidinium_carterae.1
MGHDACACRLYIFGGWNGTAKRSRVHRKCVCRCVTAKEEGSKRPPRARCVHKRVDRGARAAT